jgi:hypothetical protein
MIRRLAAALALSAISLLAPTKADAGVFDGPWTYVKDRFHDGLDIFRLRIGFPDQGRGLGAKVRVTSLAQAGYIYWHGTYVGLEKRGFGVVEERRREMGVSLLYGSFNRMEPLHGNSFLKANSDWSRIEDRRILRNLPHWDDGRQRHLSIGAEVATPLLGVDVGVYPEEILDFALGFILIDIFNDDQLFGHNTEYLDATTMPGPDGEAPFARKRREMQEFRLRMLGQDADGTADPGATSIAPSTGEAPVPAAVMPPPAGDTITPAEADAAMEALDAQAAPEAGAEPETSIDLQPEEEPTAEPESSLEPAAEAVEPKTAGEVPESSQDARFRPIRPTKKERAPGGELPLELDPNLPKAEPKAEPKK